jgi:hypothetical protein
MYKTRTIKIAGVVLHKKPERCGFRLGEEWVRPTTVWMLMKEQLHENAKRVRRRA